MRRLSQILAAGLGLLCLAMFAFSFALPAEEVLPFSDDQQSTPQPSPQPKPEPVVPLPVPPAPDVGPTGDDYSAAYERSRLNGRPLLVLFEATWCQPCKVLYDSHGAALRKNGELARVDVDRDADLYGQMCGKGGMVPRLQVYASVRDGGRLQRDLSGSDNIREFCGAPAAKSPASGQSSDRPAVQGEYALTRETDAGLTLVMVVSKAAASECHDMETVLGQVQSPWKVSVVNGDDPKVSQWIEVYGIASYPYFITYRGHEALEVTSGVLSGQEMQDWLDRVAKNLPSASNSRFARSTAQDSLKPIDREYLQQRMTAGSCGMLGCMAHGGGWIMETVKASAKKPAGHWEERVMQSSCPSGGCPGGGCPSGGTTTKVWVADPDPTGTVPWDQYQGGVFARRR